MHVICHGLPTTCTIRTHKCKYLSPKTKVLTTTPKHDDCHHSRVVMTIVVLGSCCQERFRYEQVFEIVGRLLIFVVFGVGFYLAGQNGQKRHP